MTNYINNILFLITAAFLLVGCGEKSSPSTASATNSSGSGSALTAPVDYLASVGKGQQNAIKTIDTASLTKAIQTFNVAEGRNPKDLNELVEKKYLPELPPAPRGMKIMYDANAGTVSVVKQ